MLRHLADIAKKMQLEHSQLGSKKARELRRRLDEEGADRLVLQDLAQRYAVATLILVVIAVVGIVARFVYDTKRS